MTVHVTVIINWFWKWLVMSVFIFVSVAFWKIFFCKTDKCHMLDFAWWKENDIVVKYFLFRITDFVLMLHSLMFEVTYNVVLLVLVFLFAWKGKCCCNTDVHHTFLLAWWGKKGMYIKYFHLKIPSFFVLCSLLTFCVAESVKSCVRKKKKNYMMTNISYYKKLLPPFSLTYVSGKDHILMTWPYA